MNIFTDTADSSFNNKEIWTNTWICCHNLHSSLYVEDVQTNAPTAQCFYHEVAFAKTWIWSNTS